MQWIKLHESTGKEITINMDVMESYKKITFGNYEGMTSIIPMGGNENSQHIVTETPEYIESMLNASTLLTTTSGYITEATSTVSNGKPAKAKTTSTKTTASK